MGEEFKYQFAWERTRPRVLARATRPSILEFCSPKERHSLSGSLSYHFLQFGESPNCARESRALPNHHSITVLAQVSPPPNTTIKIKSPFLIRPVRFASSSAIATAAAEVLPYLLRFT
jgi:hypothetical protein